MEVYEKYKKAIEKYSGVPSSTFYLTITSANFSGSDEEHRTNECRKLKTFVELYPQIVIYGCGVRAGRYAQFMADNGIEFECFLVSTRREAEEKSEWMNHRVIAVQDYDFQDDVGIVLGLNVQHQVEVFYILQNMGVHVGGNVFAYPSSYQYVGMIWKKLQERISHQSGSHMLN